MVNSMATQTLLFSASSSMSANSADALREIAKRAPSMGTVMIIFFIAIASSIFIDQWHRIEIMQFLQCNRTTNHRANQNANIITTARQPLKLIMQL
jgi:hypothetical protein